MDSEARSARGLYLQMCECRMARCVYIYIYIVSLLRLVVNNYGASKVWLYTGYTAMEWNFSGWGVMVLLESSVYPREVCVYLRGLICSF